MKMNKLEMQRWRTYSKTSGNRYNSRCKVDELNVHLSNSLSHEVVKLILQYRLREQKFKTLTEAWESKTIRRDLVDLSNGEVYEIEDSRSKRGHRNDDNPVNVVWYDKIERLVEQIEDEIAS